ncbi:ABC transporter permease [Nonomuraea sp. NPDC050663]|uniref:ABC transporter permease n=1 Tax=Nonomuraea sp. NPDC050663 TaxID=3364370 RepID=UPI00378FE981
MIYLEVVRLGRLLFRASEPWSITVTAVWPRVLLQGLFFTLLGRVLGLEEHAFAGALAITMLAFTVVGVADVPMADKWNGTYSRLRLGEVHIPLVFALRSLPLIVHGGLAVLLVWAVVGPVSGLALTVLPVLPIYAVMLFSTTALGLAVVAQVVGRRADVFAGNAATWLVIACSGALVPPGRLPVLDAVGAVLPVRHGLDAVRSALAGRPWLPSLVWEVVIGLGWALVAWLAYLWQTGRARRLGLDDYT